jgi:hypothetical protein
MGVKFVTWLVVAAGGCPARTNPVVTTKVATLRATLRSISIIDFIFWLRDQILVEAIA